MHPGKALPGTSKLGKLSPVAAQPPRAGACSLAVSGRGPRPLLRSERHLPPPQPIVPADLGGASPLGTAVVGECGGGVRGIS